MKSRWRRLFHRCITPDPIRADLQVGAVWTCKCGQKWKLNDEGHHEERVYMGGADADIGYDWCEWRRLP